jgi:hypothetical protein
LDERANSNCIGASTLELVFEMFKKYKKIDLVLLLCSLFASTLSTRTAVVPFPVSSLPLRGVK